MDWTGAPPGEHPHQQDKAEGDKSHEKVNAMFLNHLIQKLRDACQVKDWMFHKLVFCSLLLLPTV
jgi:hypothetical protein